jgi:hypothetical protein
VQSRFDKAYFRLHEFFGGFPEFTYHEGRNPKAEFNRLAQSRQWGKRRYNSMLEKFYQAFSDDFEEFFTAEGEDSWETLARALRMDPLPATKKRCQKVCITFFPPRFPHFAARISGVAQTLGLDEH